MLRSIARVLRTSQNARIRDRTRERERGVEEALRAPPRRRAARVRLVSGVPEGGVSREARERRTASRSLPTGKWVPPLVVSRSCRDGSRARERLARHLLREPNPRDARDRSPSTATLAISRTARRDPASASCVARRAGTPRGALATRDPSAAAGTERYRKPQSLQELDESRVVAQLRVLGEDVDTRQLRLAVPVSHLEVAHRLRAVSERRVDLRQPGRCSRSIAFTVASAAARHARGSSPHEAASCAP